MTLMPSLAAAQAVAIDSRTHCCLSTARTVVLDPGTWTLTYASGAWINHVPTGIWRGYVRGEVPALGLVLELGTDVNANFATAAEAEAAAQGDQEVIVNSTGAPVTVSLYVFDSCDFGGYCHDNSGQVLIDVQVPVSIEEDTWGRIKATYR